MIHRTLMAVAVIGLFLTVQGFSAEGDRPAGGRPAAQGGDRGTRGFGRGGFGGAGGMFGRDALRSTVTILGELNLAPDFNLSKEQKEKIQAIRDGFTKKQETWRKDHEAEIKKIDDQVAAARGGGQGSADKWQEVGRAREALYASAPKSDEAAKEIQAVLTAEQLKAFTAKQTERQADMDRMRERLGAGAGGGRGGRGGAGGGRGGARGGN